MFSDYPRCPRKMEKRKVPHSSPPNLVEDSSACNNYLKPIYLLGTLDDQEKYHGILQEFARSHLSCQRMEPSTRTIYPPKEGIWIHFPIRLSSPTLSPTLPHHIRNHRIHAGNGKLWPESFQCWLSGVLDDFHRAQPRSRQEGNPANHAGSPK